MSGQNNLSSAIDSHEQDYSRKTKDSSKRWIVILGFVVSLFDKNKSECPKTDTHSNINFPYQSREIEDEANKNNRGKRLKTWKAVDIKIIINSAFY